MHSLIQNPIFGTGANSFPEIFKIQTGIWKGHAHNLPLELIISYGIPAGLLIILPIFLITYLGTKYTFFFNTKGNQSIYDKAWVSSLIVLLITQMVDVQYFDGRISIAFWILISGSRCILNENNSRIIMSDEY